ncbi:MAG: hypothetical protein ACOC7K_00180, partial [bacterium]
RTRHMRLVVIAEGLSAAPTSPDTASQGGAFARRAKQQRTPKAGADLDAVAQGEKARAGQNRTPLPGRLSAV